MSDEMEVDQEEKKWEHLDKVLARHGPLENEDFPGDEEASRLPTLCCWASEPDAVRLSSAVALLT